MTKEEAINEVRGWDFLNDRETEAIQTLIPELIEKSGDERTREELIKLLNVLSDGIVENYTTVPLKDFVAYLEKQKDIESKYAGMVVVSQEEWNNAIAVAFEHGMNEGERQKEQKPIFKKGDKVIWDDEEFTILDVNETEYNVGGYHLPFSRQNELHPVAQKPADNVSREEYVKRFKILCDAYEIKLPNREYDIYHLCDDLAKLSMDSGKQKSAENSVYPNSLDEAIQLYYYTYGNGKGGFDYISLPKFQDAVEGFVKDYGQKSAEWSGEDETAYGDLIWCIEQAKKSAKDENDMGNIWFAENWIKNRIKYLRPQPKQEWSEEDVEKLAKNRASKSGTLKSEMIFYRQGVRDAFNYKGMCPHWKPSEEQMETLKDVINRALLTCRQQGPLESLYNDLKKLPAVE